MPSYISAMRLCGFKSVGDQELHVDVPPGLVAVIGRYDASLPSTLTAISRACVRQHAVLFTARSCAVTCILVPSSCNCMVYPTLISTNAWRGACMHIGMGPARAMSWLMLSPLHAAARLQRFGWRASVTYSPQRRDTRQRHAICCLCCLHACGACGGQVHAVSE